MKKIYTLFAFAALCVSGCTNDITEGGNISSKYNTVTLEALAHTDESRALVNDELNGFIWNFEEESDIAVLELVDNECGENGTLNEDYTASHNRVARGAFNSSKSDSGAGLAVFDVTLKSDNKKDVARSYLVAYPYSALGKFCQGNNHCAEMTIPEVQKPCKECLKTINNGTKVYNIDPEATVMFAVDKNLGSNDQTQTTHPYQLDLNFDHVASYARLRIYGLNLMTKDTPLDGDGHASEKLMNDEVVDHIVFETLDENEYLAGVWKFDFSDNNEENEEDRKNRHTESAPCTDRCSNRIMLDVKHLGITATGQALDFALYFAAMPVNIANGFTVTVVTTEGHIYKRTVSTGKLSFERATVKNFSVSFNNIEPEKAVYLKAYKKQYGVPASGFDNDKKYIFAVHTFDNTYTLDNESHSNVGTNLDTSGFVVVTEGDDVMNLDRPYLLHQEVETAEKYAWTLTGSGNQYTISHGGYYWWDNGSVIYLDSINLTLSNTSQSNWSFNYDSRYFNINNNGRYICFEPKPLSWNINNKYSSTIDIYEDEGGYYWNPASDDNQEEPELPDVYYSKFTETYPFKSGMTTINYAYLSKYPSDKFIITAKYNGNVYLVGCISSLVEKPQLLEEAGFELEGEKLKCKDDSKYAFQPIKSSDTAFRLFGPENYLVNTTSSLSIGSNNVTWQFKQVGNDFKMRCGSNSSFVLMTGEQNNWSWTYTDTSGSDFTIYKRE